MSDPIDISIITASYNLLKSGRKEKIIFQKSENADRRHQAGKSYLAVCKSKRCKNHRQLEKGGCQRLPGDLRPQ